MTVTFLENYNPYKLIKLKEEDSKTVKNNSTSKLFLIIARTFDTYNYKSLIGYNMDSCCTDYPHGLAGAKSFIISKYNLDDDIINTLALFLLDSSECFFFITEVLTTSCEASSQKTSKLFTPTKHHGIANRSNLLAKELLKPIPLAPIKKKKNSPSVVDFLANLEKYNPHGLTEYQQLLRNIKANFPNQKSTYHFCSFLFQSVYRSVDPSERREITHLTYNALRDTKKTYLEATYIKLILTAYSVARKASQFLKGSIGRSLFISMCTMPIALALILSSIFLYDYNDNKPKSTASRKKRHLFFINTMDIIIALFISNKISPTIDKILIKIAHKLNLPSILDQQGSHFSSPLDSEGKLAHDVWMSAVRNKCS